MVWTGYLDILAFWIIAIMLAGCLFVFVFLVWLFVIVVVIIRNVYFKNGKDS